MGGCRARSQGGFLVLRGRLAVCREWVATHRDELNPIEDAFLAASEEAEWQREQDELENRRLREAAEARKRDAEDTPRVFVSYSWDSVDHTGRVLELADALRGRGIDVILDQYVHPTPEEGWPRWMDRSLDEAQFVLMVCTETYRRRVMGREEPGKGFGVRWEGSLIYNRIYNDKPSGSRFIPILLLPGSEPAHIPNPVQGHSYYRIRTFDLTDPGFEALYRHLTDRQKTNLIVETERRIEKARRTRAQRLDLSRCGLTELPQSLGQLGQLQTLGLSGNQLTALPESLGQLAQLQSLDLSGNQLTALPESLGQLAQLQSLDLSGNQLTALPESLGQLAQLQSLDLSGNQLTALPESLGQLAQLQSLVLSGNQLTALPESLGQLAQLQSLVLSGNQLTALPESLGQLAQLQSLDLSGNQLTALPESLGQLAQLQSLVLSGNQLTVLPESLGQLAQLQSLVLSGNQLTALPESLGQLVQVQSLDLSRNRLTALPESLGQLAQVQSLVLSGNQLTALPESLGQLAQLQLLDLSGNQLTALPESLEQLKQLRQLYLHGNDGLRIPPEILGPTYEDVRGKNAIPTDSTQILRYYYRIRAGTQPLNEVKLILLGRGGVGKTSLVDRLVHHTFDPDSAKTEGIQITQWQLTVEDEEVRLHVWDFGGQEIMHATHQFFLTERGLYLVVLSGREGGEDADAEYWLKLVASFGGGSPVFLVLNKMVQHPFDLDRRGLRQKYPNIREFVATDCNPVRGLDELKEKLLGVLSGWDARRVAFPASWFAIKERLATMSESYLSFDRFRQVCRELGEADGAEQESLAGHLHTLGIALNYKDDPRLRDTHVLNPHWVTGGIYRILNAPLLADRKGVLHMDDLPRILPEDDYPRTMHLFLLDLMRKFDLGFPFPDDADRYLVPELLDKQQAPEAEQFSPDDCLRFEYRYNPILPEGLLPRFIVRTHSMSEEQPRCARGDPRVSKAAEAWSRPTCKTRGWKCSSPARPATGGV